MLRYNGDETTQEEALEEIGYSYSADPHDPVPFAKDDIAEVVRFDYDNRPSGGWDGDYFAVVRLRDGRWAYMEASHDSTGYDCQGYLNAWVADSEKALWPQMSEEGRGRLGFERVADSQERCVDPFCRHKMEYHSYMFGCRLCAPGACRKTELDVLREST